MTHVAVTIEFEQGKRTDLALPLNIPSHILSNAVAEAIKLDPDGKKTFIFAVKGEHGLTRIPAQSNLGDMGILDGTILQLGAEKSSTGQTATGSHRQPVLRTENGRSFVLEAKSLLIGRNDHKRGWVVDIDLAPFDPQKIVSRRHARLERQGARWMIVEDPECKNGTWLNGHKLTHGEAYPLENGDEIILGRNGVILRYEMD